MINYVKIGIIIFCIVLFGGIAGFAQQNDLANVSTPESSKMFKNPNGLISSSAMQADEKEVSDKSDKSNTKNVSGKWKTIKRR